ncbi:DUF692 domain-containing protein [Sphingomonas sp. SUN039]|uniref:MNIO family bufferin maturase n=1 Tax=Sphingomonas sp. SUN039 TaxID=2937787 RepID=UPI00216490C5|nr:DUF692 domain-containing protein [Sphingomonas sp. SUN039]UVO55314.1 DUF692 domain-containing protein [Sphingomonas sp. SUN039]
MHPTVGIGLKADHFGDAIASPTAGLWFEVHPENYMVAGGPRLAMLEAARAARPLSLHGVGMSLAGAADPDRTHLAALKRLVDRFEPFRVSEHLAWSRIGDRCFPDLLPFPRTGEALARVVRNVDIAQSALGRTILIENPTHYLGLDGHVWSEPDFLREIVRRTGCGLLLDINNVAVSAHNLGFDADAYLADFPAAAVGEIHLAGYTPDGATDLLIDGHNAPVADDVWALYARFIARNGQRPTLIERDADLPPFSELLDERNRAADLLTQAVRELEHA